MINHAIHLRAMTQEDLDAASRLGIASKATWGYDEDAMRVFATELTLSSTSLDELLDAQVACENDEIIGYYTIRRHADGITELEHLFVRPDRFRKGVGTTLLQKALATTATHGIETLTVIADPNSSGFYESHGAIRTGDHQSSISGRTIPVYELSTTSHPPIHRQP